MWLSAFMIGGALWHLMALVKACLLVALMAPTGPALQRLLPNRADIVRSHIDYLMMALFLFVFYGLCRLTGAAPANWLIIAACAGAFFNRFAFLIHAIRPDIKVTPPAALLTATLLSCVANRLRGDGVDDRFRLHLFMTSNDLDRKSEVPRLSPLGRASAS